MNLADSLKLLRFAEGITSEMKLDGVFMAVLYQGKTTFITTQVPEKLRAAIHEASAERMGDKHSVKVLGDVSTPDPGA